MERPSRVVVFVVIVCAGIHSPLQMHCPPVNQNVARPPRCMNGAELSDVREQTSKKNFFSTFFSPIFCMFHTVLGAGNCTFVAPMRHP